MNNLMYFEIQAEEPSKLVEFYSKIFGWKCIRDENIPIEYWRIETEGIGGAILQRPAKTPGSEQGTNAYVCSMEVEDFDATANEIIKLGGQVALEKFAIAGKCWQGYFLDTAGNTFGIFQVDESAA